MSAAVRLDLTTDQRRQIEEALAPPTADSPPVVLDLTRVKERDGELFVPVTPQKYPERMFAFMERLAEAEINLRGAGLRETLVPDVRQRELVVADWPGRKIAYLSSDGSELQDLATLLGVSQEDLVGVIYDGYAYDTEQELAEVIAVARREHPEADFSRISTLDRCGQPVD